MVIGSPKHKAQYISNLLKDYQEQIWKNEIQLQVGHEALGSLRKERAQVDLMLENKEFPSAGEGRKALKQIDERITNTEANIAAITQAIENDTQTMAQIRKYGEIN